MYLWALLSGDTADPPSVRGITDNLDRAMQVTEPYLIEERAFLCRIVQVRHAMSVPSMDMCYVPTGRAWNGRRNNRGRVTWQETETQAGPPARTRTPVRPDAVYRASGTLAATYTGQPLPGHQPLSPRCLGANPTIASVTANSGTYSH